MRLHELVILQAADGTWPLTRKLASLLGRELDDLHAAAGVPLNHPDTIRAWGTALVLTWLELYAADFRDEWEMLAQKSSRWLVTVPPPSSEHSWIGLAGEVLKDR